MCANFVLTAVLTFAVTFVNAELNPYRDALRVKHWESVQNYVEIRPDAFMFYWLYYADGTKAEASKKPLVIWIQGGPGLAASGIANFAEIGPLTMDLKPRKHTWVNGRNLLLIDHPVGTGFSYVTNETLLVKTDRDAALDLSRLIKAFLRRHKEFRKTPTYLFSQSYGGKLCPRLAYYLHSAIQKNRLKMNFKGIGIGSGYVDPKETTLVYPEYLYMMGVLDRSVYMKAVELSSKVAALIDKKEYRAASKMQRHQFNMLNEKAGMVVNFNNINQPSPYPSLARLQVKVNAYVKPTLPVDQHRIWSFMAENVFDSLQDSFLVASNKFLEMLLNNTNLRIAVYNGNLDIVTPLAGASNWVHKLKWPGAKKFRNAQKYPIRGERNGFYKEQDNLSFWWVYGAGHWVPEENPEAMEQILDHVIKPENSKHNPI